jgi:hypothetical protein
MNKNSLNEVIIAVNAILLCGLQFCFSPLSQWGICSEFPLIRNGVTAVN